MHQLKETLRLVGIDASIFSGHSVRDTSTSAAVEAGITMTESRCSKGSIIGQLTMYPMEGLYYHVNCFW